MRTFKQFPKESICPICGTNDDKECFLAEIDGTRDDDISEAQPFHVDCLLKGHWQYSKQIKIIYRETK